MKNDSYLQKKNLEYGIRVQNILTNPMMSSYHEYVFQLLRPVERKSILLKVSSEFEKYFRTDSGPNQLRNNELSALGVDEYIESVLKIENVLEKDAVQSILYYLSRAEFDQKKWSNGFDELLSNFPSLHAIVLKEFATVLSRKVGNPIGDSDYLKNLQEIKKIFKLSSLEAEVITFFYLNECDTAFSSFFDSEIDIDNVSRSFRHFLSLFETDAQQLKRAFKKDGALFKSGIFSTKGSRRGLNFDLSHEFLAILAGASDLNILENYIQIVDCSQALEISDLNVEAETTNTVLKLMTSRSGVNFLLHGKPGTGKTEYVKTIGKVMGRKVYFVKQEETIGQSPFNRRTAIVAALNVVDPNESILVVDESDSILNFKSTPWDSLSDFDTKGWLNELLENVDVKVFWITNEIKGIDSSTRRRFSFSIEFSNLGLQQRRRVWENQIRIHAEGLLNADDISRLASRYKINAGAIALSLKNVQTIQGTHLKEEKMALLEDMLNQHQKFLYGQTKLAPISQNYDISFLNTNSDLMAMIEHCEKFLNGTIEFKDQEILNLNILLHGPPGTGKTEFVKFLAARCGKELIVKRMSDLMSMWVGGTESKIAEAFSEAEESQSILFLDEADSLFINRESASRSWEISQTNELLCQMENFKGILVCATNFEKNLDHASLRRFNFKVRFDFLSSEGKIQMFYRIFSGQFDFPIDSNWEKEVESIPFLTPGDFKVVRHKNYFAKNLSIFEIIDQLRIESSYKNPQNREIQPLGVR